MRYTTPAQPASSLAPFTAHLSHHVESGRVKVKRKIGQSTWHNSGSEEEGERETITTLE